MNARQLFQVNGVEICAQTFGEPVNPTILLIAGANSSMDWWQPDFCERLAAGSRFVVRYDQRDTGQSVSYPPGAPGYTGDDLVADAAGLLRALDRPSANVVGISMGGAIAQVLTLAEPALVGSLTLISTSAGPGDPDLPPMGAGLPDPDPDPDWTDRASVIEHVVAEARAYAATSVPFDEEEIRSIAAVATDRSRDVLASQTNHALAGGGGPWRKRLTEIGCPTVVIHGTEDPLFPLGHGVALAREIPGAQLLTLQHTGHELPRRVWDEAIPAILTVSTPDWPQRADLLAAAAFAAGEPTAWFERLYGGALRGQSELPWDRGVANPFLTQWTATRAGTGAGQRAVVVGCGLGADAEHVAAQGFDTDAFDLAESAISTARSRRPDSTVRYRQADALELPAEWHRAFDLVVEAYTAQAIPDPPRGAVMRAVADLVADGGRLLVIALARQDGQDASDGPPFALLRAELDGFAANGLVPAEIELVESAGERPHWRAEFRRPAAATDSG